MLDMRIATRTRAIMCRLDVQIERAIIGTLGTRVIITSVCLLLLHFSYVGIFELAELNAGIPGDPSGALGIPQNKKMASYQYAHTIPLEIGVEFC